MKSTSLLITLLSCCATATEARSFVNRPAFPISSSKWASMIPRGGSDDAPSNSNGLDMNSLLSSMASGMSSGMPGLPDLNNPPSPEQIQQSMAQFQSLLNSPQFQSMLNDPSKMEEQLENARVNLLKLLSDLENGEGELGGNPMMKMMMDQMKEQVGQMYPGGWDGLKELVENEEKWKVTMSGFIDVIKSMGDEDWSSIMNGMGGMGGMGGGMPGMGGMGGFPGMGAGAAGSTLGDAFGGDSAGTLAGLDELSEGED